LNLIRRIKEKGHRVAVSDMNPSAPGLALADYPSVASSFDTDAVIRAARKAGTERFLTLGTDQPVLTAARASEALNLPYFLNVPQARLVTNKADMKEMFRDQGIPAAPYRLLEPGFRDSELEGLRFPLVIKPLDSQGQRGVLSVGRADEIRSRMDEVLGFSRENRILAEEFYPSREITLSGWVYRGKPWLFSITDRETVENDPYMGVCVSHRYPSRFHRDWDELEELSARICRAVGLKEGPIYFQILGGEQGYRLNEIACRLGGAYEDEFLPGLCGADPLDLLIEQTINPDYTWDHPETMAELREGKYFSLQMFFCRPGEIRSQQGMDRVLGIPGVRRGRFLLPDGTVIRNRENSTQRAGYFFMDGGSPEEINGMIDRAYERLEIRDEEGRNMIERSKRMYFPR
jgi:biotin carboxylase